MLTGLSHEESIRLCKTKKSGTFSHHVVNALNEIGIKNHIVYLNDLFEKLWWLKNCSLHFPIYVAGEFISNSGRGRNSHRHHAFAIYNGMIYDPSEDVELDYDCNKHTFNRELVIQSIIILDKEVEGYGLNK
jgi:hypothetical protein